MRRFTILSLMGLILFLALAFAALRSADDHWAAVLQFLMLGLLGVGVLGVIHGSGKGRAAWVGFVLFGGIYHLLAAGPWISDQARLKLPTTLLLDYAYQHAPTKSLTFTSPAWTPLSSAPTDTSQQAQQWVFTSNSAPLAAGAIMVFYSNEPYQRIGHSFFALLAGWIGAIISRRMFNGREVIHNAPLSVESSNMI